MVNNWLHKTGANSALYNLEIKGFPLLSHIFIWNYPVCFAVTKYPSTTSIYLSVSTNEPGIKPEISGVVWKITPESKTQPVSCDLPP